MANIQRTDNVMTATHDVREVEVYLVTQEEKYKREREKGKESEVRVHTVIVNDGNGNDVRWGSGVRDDQSPVLIVLHKQVIRYGEWQLQRRSPRTQSEGPHTYHKVCI